MNKNEYNIVSGRQDFYLHEVMFISLLAAAVIHGGLIAYFFWLGIPEMGVYNVFSTLLYIVGFWFFRSIQSYSILYLIIGSSEVILHAILATYFVGTAAGFPLFLWAIPPVLILHAKIPDWGAIAGSLLVGVMYVLITEVLMSEQGIYTMDQITNDYTYYVCFFSAVSITMAIIFYYRKVVGKKEQIILREIHHRIKNNLQMVSSIASIRNTEIQKESTGKALDELKTDVWYLSTMHNQVMVTDRGTLINFSQFMEAVLVGENLKSEANESNNELMLNLETGIPLGLITSQIVEFCNRLKANHNDAVTSFSFTEVADGFGEICIALSCASKIDLGRERIEESSTEIITLLLEQLEGHHQIHQGENGIEFNVQYKLI